jgi:hypothetical protein
VVPSPRPAPPSETRPGLPGATPPTFGAAVWFRVFVAVGVRPRLWRTALRQWGRIVPRGWWRGAPRLPVPPRRYVGFRLETAYGPGARVEASDIVEYLEWCRTPSPREAMRRRR